MKRNIIRIDEEKCNGCGLCIPNCPEGALQIIDGKARVVNEFSCDGLGACLGHCPEGAISIEEREAQAYDEKKAMANIVKSGAGTIKAHLKHLHEHGEKEYLAQAEEYLKKNKMGIPEYKTSAGGGCPGSKIIDRREETVEKKISSEEVIISSQLKQWPVQLKLLNPNAPYFKNADLLLAADCVPFSCADFHSRFLKDKIVIIFCPKLDAGLDEYIEKLAEIIRNNDLKSIMVARMEVPCCGGMTSILKEALEKAGGKIEVKEVIVSLKGDII